MDGELVSGSTSSSEGSESSTTPLYTYTEKFNECFPYYLSIGMTEEQYWDKDCNLVKFYRKADEMRTDKISFEAWLQGRYIYDAMLAVSPVLHAFAKKGAKPIPYMDEPYALTEERAKKKEEAKEKATYNSNKAFMESFMVKFNKQFE